MPWRDDVCVVVEEYHVRAFLLKFNILKGNATNAECMHDAWEVIFSRIIKKNCLKSYIKTALVIGFQLMKWNFLNSLIINMLGTSHRHF